MYKNLDKRYVMACYNRFDKTLIRGHNATIIDIECNEMIDFTSGIGVNSLGYCDDDWSEAVGMQAKKLQHTSNLYYNEPSTLLAKNLCTLTGMNKVLFANSGAEANEAAFKLARKYSTDKYGEKRCNILSLKQSFHGRTMATLSATGQDSFHQYFYPFLSGHKYCDATYNSFINAINDSFAAVVMELIQGEGGIVCLNNEFVKRVSDYCNAHDILLIIDEVQTGVGRTGKFLACEHYGLKPDIITLAKGLGGGLPIGACLANAKCCDVFTPGTHGTTFGGNPVVAAGANVVLNKVSKAEFLDSVAYKGELMKQEILTISGVTNVSGLGMMLGIKLKSSLPVRIIAELLLESKLMVLTAKDRIRLLPPLTISIEELMQGLAIFKSVLEKL